jgi:hypothetical protein
MAREWIGFQITIAGKTVQWYEHSGKFLVQCHVEDDMITKNRESAIAHNIAEDTWEGWVHGERRAVASGANGKEKVIHQMSHMLRGYRGDVILPHDICPDCTWEMVS